MQVPSNLVVSKISLRASISFFQWLSGESSRLVQLLSTIAPVPFLSRIRRGRILPRCPVLLVIILYKKAVCDADGHHVLWVSTW